MSVSKDSASGPLAGVKVVDLSIFALGPLATQILADMGAEVIKIESPRGDDNRRMGPSRSKDMAAMFFIFNRGKRSVVLDLKRQDHKDALMRLVDQADVFVHGMRPQAAKRLGIGYEAISKRNPRIIYAFGTGYRQDGPFKEKPAFDDVIQAASGIAGAMERANGQPTYMPSIMVDKFCGYVLASSIAMALYARECTGKGQEVQVPMLETTINFMLHEHLFGGAFDPPFGPLGYPRMFAKYRRPYQTKDGHISLIAVNDEQWNRLMRAVGRPECMEEPRFATLDQRTNHIGDLYEILSDQLKGKTTAEWKAILDAADVPNSPVMRLEDLPNDPYLKETDFFHHYDHPSEGRMVTTSIPVSFSQTKPALRRPPPQLGEHTVEVLKEVGYTNDEIQSMRNPAIS